MKTKCINSKRAKAALTNGTEYKVIDYSPKFYKVMDDNGELLWVSQTRFSNNKVKKGEVVRMFVRSKEDVIYIPPFTALEKHLVKGNFYELAAKQSGIPYYDLIDGWSLHQYRFYLPVTEVKMNEIIKNEDFKKEEIKAILPTFPNVPIGQPKQSIFRYVKKDLLLEIETKTKELNELIKLLKL